MIRLPVWTLDKARRGVVVWDAGQLSVERGSLLEQHPAEITAELLREHQLQNTDASEPGEVDRGDVEAVQGVSTREHLLFAANFLPMAGYAPDWSAMEDDGQ